MPSTAYPIAGLFLLLALLPIYLFGAEALLTSFNEDWGAISSIASYYESNFTDDSDSGVIFLIQKLAIPIFAGLSANRTWRVKYKWMRNFAIAYVLIAIALIFGYEYILSVDVPKERLEMFNISPNSLSLYFDLHKDPLFTLLAILTGLEIFQKATNTAESGK